MYETTQSEYVIDPQADGPLAWQANAYCRRVDAEIFFPKRGGSTRMAKLACGACVVRGDCLDYALANDERHGVWGGLTERERHGLKRRTARGS